MVNNGSPQSQLGIH